jgi:hypothetical protein
VTVLVYLVRPGDRNEELRYSLRSVVANVPHERVVMAGYTPSWVTGVESIDVPQAGNKYQNTTANLLEACGRLADDGVGDAVLFNDDFFVVEPIEAVPALHQGPVHAVARRVRRQLGSKAAERSGWLEGMLGTEAMLRAYRPAVEPLSYELHVPLPFDPMGMWMALRLAEEHRDRFLRPGVPVHKRTWYGNLVGLGGVEVRDVKMQAATGRQWPPGPFVSTIDETFNRRSAGVELRRRFPDPCRYEVR